MTRWLRLLGALWRLNVAEVLQYRANLIASILGTVFWIGTALLTLAVFFRHAERLGGWEFWEVVTLLGVFSALSGLVEAILRPGIGQLVEDVREGGLDLVLVRPVDPLALVSLRRLDLWRFTDVLFGLGLAAFALAHMGRLPSVLEVAAFLVTLAAAGLVVYAVWVALMSLAFWFVAVENLSVLFDSVFQAARYPASAYPGALRFVFVYLLPIAWTTTVPASALTGRLAPGIAVGAVAVGAAALLAARLVWLLALRRYTGASG